MCGMSHYPLALAGLLSLATWFWSQGVLAWALTENTTDALLRRQVPTRAEIRAWERALLSQGGSDEGSFRKLPDQLLVWRPENAGSWDFFDAKSWDFCEALVSCLKRTVRGDRAFVYESGEGITALVDFQGSSYWLDDWGYVAPGVFRPLNCPVPRSDLVERNLLKTVFGPGSATKHPESDGRARWCDCRARQRSATCLHLHA
jgi:hypothetical protein